MTEVPVPPGLTSEPKERWPEVREGLPIDRLRPGSELHGKVLEYLRQRIRYSERKMSNFYARWRVNEQKVQCYIDLPDYEQILKNQNAEGKPAQAVSIVIPYTFAAVLTIATYHLHTFTGRKPMFQVASNKAETAKSAQNMELVLQYMADHTRMVGALWQFILDGLIYGVAPMRCTWSNIRRMRTVWRDEPSVVSAILGLKKRVKVREMHTVYSGNAVSTIDPFMFFPDPRVPMHKVAHDGEWVVWREFMGRHRAKILEADGVWKWVDYAGTTPRIGLEGEMGQSSRGLSLGGDAHPGRSGLSEEKVSQSLQVDQGSFVIIPAELGLSESQRPEKWLFTIINSRQIVQAEPLDLDHGMHPVVVSEPTSFGYGFGQPSIVDFTSPFQDTLSWLVNSHIHNTRAALNNQFVVDPSRIEMQDVRNPSPGKIIRVKPAGYGQDVSSMFQQFPIMDVTQQHMANLGLFLRIADIISGLSDNLRGQQDSGGRKTATEVRTTAEAAASRLAAQSRVISAQAIVDLTEQMTTNVQQFLEEDIYLQIVGQAGLEAPIQISPEMLVGDFHYPIHDGTLPLDRVALLDVFKEIYTATMQDPLLAQTYDRARLFEFMAELGGARNINNFRVTVAPDQTVETAVERGDMAPMERVIPGQRPAARAAEGVL